MSRPSPSHSISAPMRAGGQRWGGTRANPRGTTSSSPTWERPNSVIPHWETPGNPPPNWELSQSTRIHHNPGQDRDLHPRGWGGVGYVGLPYYASPFAYSNAWDWWDDGDDDQASVSGNTGGPGYYGPQPSYDPDPYDSGYSARPPYDREAQQSGVPSQSATQSDGLDHPPVTLVFNDGRPSEKVQSYLLTNSSIFVADPGHQRKIPIAQLDLPATIEQNREAGVDFELPSGSR